MKNKSILQSLRFLTLLGLMCVCTNMLGATTKTCTVTSTTGTTSPVKIDNVSWTLTTENKTGSPTITNSSYSKTYGLKFGSSSSNYWGKVTLSTDYFSDYNIESVTVNVLNNGNKAGTLSVTQGTTTIGSSSKSFGTTWTDLTANTNKGSGGTLNISYSVAQASYIHSITVVYSTGGGTPLDAPTNLTSSNITEKGATLSWDAVTNANGYRVKIGDTEYDANTNSYTASELTAETEYTWTVKAIGDGSTYSSSDYADSKTFTTLASTASKITINASSIEGFAGSYAKRTWTAGGISGQCFAWRSGSEGAYLMQFNNTPYVYNTDAVQGRIKSIKIVKGGGSERSWSVYVANSPLTSTTGATQVGSAQTVSSEYTWTVPSNLNCSYFYITKGSNSTQISEFVIEYEPAQLAAPTNLQYSNITTSGATLSWDAVAFATSYTLKYKKSSDADFTSISSVTSPYGLSSLDANSTYNWKVQAIGNGSSFTDSEDAGGTDFTTLQIGLHSLSSAVNPDAAGSVTLSATSLSESSQATATANANSGYTFSNWTISGEGATLSSNTDNPTTITMGTADAVVTANFTPIAVEGVSLDITEKTVEIGANPFTLIATVSPSEALNKNVTWSTSNENVATVNNGTVTIVGVGSATITVTTEDGGKTATCSVTVNPKVDYATLPVSTGNNGKSSLGTGFTYELGSDYSGDTPLKFDATGRYLILKINEVPGILTYQIANNTFSGGTFTLEESANGEYYSAVKTYTNINNGTETIKNLASTTRYIRWIYTTKSSGNVGLGQISLAKPLAKNAVTFAQPAVGGTFAVSTEDGSLTSGALVSVGTEVALAPSYATHYSSVNWSVTKTGDTETTVTVTDNKFTMPNYAVTISATFVEDAKYTLSAAYNEGGTYSVKIGEADAVTIDQDKTFENVYTGTQVLLTMINPATGYKIGSTPFALDVAEGQTKPTLNSTGVDNQKRFTVGSCDVDITASFSKLYALSMSNGEHGTSLSLVDKNDNSITEASYGTYIYVNVGTPDEGYQLNELYYLNNSEKVAITKNDQGKYMFTMQSYNITVYATYSAIPYTITYVKGAEDVTGTVPVDNNTYTINTKATLLSGSSLSREGYAFNGWSDGNAVYQSGDEYTVTGYTTMTAQWAAIHEFTAMTSANGTFTATYGSQTCSSSDEGSINVPAGQTVTLTVSPATDYRCDGFTFVSGSTATKISDTEWTFVMPDDDEMAQAIFVSTVAKFAASVEANIQNGTIALEPASGDLSAQKIGDKIYLSNTPDTHYKLTEWLFKEGESVRDIQVYVEDGTNKQYFLMPGYNVTVSATFSEYYTITTSVTGNGSIGVQLGDQVAPTTTIDCYVGTSVTATATPASEDYEFKSWTISGTEYSSTNNVATFTMPSQNVSITATFDAIPKYTLTYHVKGQSTQIENVRRDTNVKSLLSEVVTGDNFHAWSTTEDATLGNLLSNEATMQGDMNVYAVYEIEGTSTWTKVTSNPQDWTGEYALVYETTVEDVPTAFIWTGVDNASCYVSATIDDNTIEMPSGAAKLSINPMTGGYSIKVVGGTNDGKYISGKSGDNNLIYSDDAVLNTLAYSSDNTTTLITSNTSVMRWNDSSNQKRFRYYKASGYDAQQAIQLYKKSTGESTYSLEIPYNVTLNSIDGDHFYGTVCLPTDFTIATDDVKAFKAAKSGSVVTMTSITEETNHVAAGEPVVLYCKAVEKGGSSMTATLTKNVTATVDEPKPSDGNVLSGTFSDIVITDATKSDYLGFGAATISGVRQVGFFSIKSGNKIGAYKAYIDTKEQDIKSFVLDLDDTPTGVIEITDTNDSNNEAIYNIGGQKLNKLQKGINIVNGKKVYVQ